MINDKFFIERRTKSEFLGLVKKVILDSLLSYLFFC